MAEWELDVNAAIPTRDEMVADTLRKAIFLGELTPGQKLDQKTIAEHLNVSRSPVREALKTLAAEGLVEMQPHRTATVTQLSLEELREIYEIRLVLEALACRLAAPNMDEGRIARLDTLLKAMDDARSRSEWLDYNSEFHVTIYEAANRPRLLAMIDGLRNAIAPYIRHFIASEERKRESRQEHAALVEACRVGDGKRAEEVVRKHISTSAEFTLHFLSEKIDGNSG